MSILEFLTSMRSGSLLGTFNPLNTSDDALFTP
jgi:hypothetical protein